MTFIGLMWGSQTHAAYQLQCSPTGELSSFSRTGPPRGCESYTTLKTKSCGDAALPHTAPGKIGLANPVNGYHSTRNSMNYNRESVKKIIQLAVNHKADPYLYLAIMMVEAPVTSMNSLAYIAAYGIPPLDSIAAIDAMNCTFNNQKGTVTEKVQVAEDELNGRNSIDGVFETLTDGKRYTHVNIEEKQTLSFARGSKERLQLRLWNAKTTDEHYVLMLKENDKIQPPRYYLAPASINSANQCQEQCCADLYIAKDRRLDLALVDGKSYTGKINANQKFETEATPLRRIAISEISDELGAQLGAQFLKKKFAAARKLNFIQKNPGATRLAQVLQSYNGYGTFGATEKMTNQCLRGLSMKTSPVYGAGIADLMLNALMSNSEIKALVDESIPTPYSTFCEELGPGTHTMDELVFAKIQQNALRGRNGCTKLTYDFNAKPLATSQTSEASVDSEITY